MTCVDTNGLRSQVRAASDSCGQVDGKEAVL
jgi:hypothetical protein